MAIIKSELIETYFLQAAKLIQNKVWQHFDKTIESAEKWNYIGELVVQMVITW